MIFQLNTYSKPDAGRQYFLQEQNEFQFYGQTWVYSVNAFCIICEQNAEITYHVVSLNSGHDIRLLHKSPYLLQTFSWDSIHQFY